MRGIAPDDTDGPAETHLALFRASPPIQPQRTKTLAFHRKPGRPWLHFTIIL
jgi:hypothetical protein